jgi:uncharacterized repeat protein (TIGR01451 family)
MTGVPIGPGDVGIGLTLTIDWAGEGGTSGSNSVSFSVPLQTQTVSLSFTRTANNNSVQKGDQVKLTYNLKNTGTATITNLTLSDSCVTGAILTGLTLSPGDSKTVSSTITVNSEIESIPKAEFTAGGAARTKTLEPLRITIVNSSLSVSATANKTQVNAGESVTFSITIQNDSPVAVSGIKVTDDLGTVVRESVSIQATTGTTPRTVVVVYDVPMATGRAVSFSITYLSGGEPVVKTTDQIVVNVMGLVPGMSPLELIVTPSPVAMTFPGTVTFTVNIRNISGQTISGISVSEATIGAIGSVISLGPGAQQQLIKTVTLNQAGAFTFTATGTDMAGVAIVPAQKQVSVTSSVGSPTPSVVNPSKSDTLNTLFIVLVVIVVLIVLAGVTLAVLMIQERRHKQNGAGGGLQRKRRRYDQYEENDEGDEYPVIDEPEAPFEDSGSKRASMEQTQPILRTTIASRTAGATPPAEQRRRFSPESRGVARGRAEDGLSIEEDDVYGPASAPEAKPKSGTATETARNDARNLRSQRRTQHGEDRLDEPTLGTLDRSTPKRPSRDENKPDVHLKYENDDDDLPPLLPRRRR